LLGLFGAPAVIRRPWNCAPLALLAPPVAQPAQNFRVKNFGGQNI